MGNETRRCEFGREKTAGINLDACNPEQAYRFLQEGDVRRGFARMAERGGHHRGFRALLPAEAGERTSRTHFQQRAASSLQQSPSALVEPNGVTEMTDPVCRVRRFGCL